MQRKTLICYGILLIMVSATAYSTPSQTANLLQPAKRVVFVYNAGDVSTGPVSLAADANEDRIRAQYGNRSDTQVIVLSHRSTSPKEQPTRENFQRVISELKNIQTLDIKLVGHGEITSSGDISSPWGGDTQTLDPERFPIQRYGVEPVSSKIIRNEAQFIVASNAGSPADFALNSLGIGDFETAIRLAQKNNPNLVTSVLAMNCYSGSLASGLSRVDGVQVFASSPATFPAYLIPTRRMSATGELQASDFTDNVQLFESALSQGMTYQAAFEWTLRETIRLRTTNGYFYGSLVPEELYSLPGSSSQEFVSAWCRKNGTKDISQNSQNAVSKITPQHEESTLEQTQTVNALENLTKLDDIRTQYWRHHELKIGCDASSAPRRAVDGEKAKIFEEAMQNRQIEAITDQAKKMTKANYINRSVAARNDRIIDLRKHNAPDVTLQKIEDETRELRNLSDQEFENRRAAAIKLVEASRNCNQMKKNKNSSAKSKTCYAQPIDQQIAEWTDADLKKVRELTLSCEQSDGDVFTRRQRQRNCLSQLSKGEAILAGMIANTLGDMEKNCGDLKKVNQIQAYGKRCLDAFTSKAGAEDRARIRELYLLGQQRPGSIASTPIPARSSERTQ